MDEISVNKVFGELLKELRTEQKITQEKLAELCNLDRTYISLLERGLRQPTLNTLIKLSEALNIKFSELMSKFERLL